MAKYTVVEEASVETKSEKRVRIFLAVMFFIQVILAASFPLMEGDVDGKGIAALSAVKLMIQPNGYSSFKEVMIAVYGAILVVMPIVAFFFCLLDKKSKKKYVLSALTSILCPIIICFGVGGTIAIGGVFTLFINIITLFMTSQGFQATRMRERAS